MFQLTLYRGENNILMAMALVPHLTKAVTARMARKWSSTLLKVVDWIRYHCQRMVVTVAHGTDQTSDSMYSNTTDMSHVP